MLREYLLPIGHLSLSCFDALSIRFLKRKTHMLFHFDLLYISMRKHSHHFTGRETKYRLWWLLASQIRCSLDCCFCKDLWRQEFYSSHFIPCLFRRGGARLMQNKQKALVAGGNRARCKVTSSGSEHKQSWLPAHLRGKYWTLGINSASLPHLDWKRHLEDVFHCSHFLSVFWVRSSESS